MITKTVSFILLSLCLAFSSQARETSNQSTKDVSWLKEVQTPPAKIPTTKTGTILPLLKDDAGNNITSLESWKQKRKQLKKQWLDLLGSMPCRNHPLNIKIIEEDRKAGCIRQLIEYDVEPGVREEGYLLKPFDLKPNEKRAAILVLHPTNNDTIRVVAGLSAKVSRQQGIQFCQKGFIVFCPKCFLWKKGVKYNANAAAKQFLKKHPKALGMKKMLFDAQRGIDVLEALPQVDQKRIGTFGHSLGAKEVFYVAAFDDRIKVAAASEGGIGLHSTNWDAPWYLGKIIHDPNFKRNHHELLALAAPKPFLILGGESGRGAADGDRSWNLIQPAMAVYQLYENPTRLAFYNHHQGHDVPPKSQRPNPRMVHHIPHEKSKEAVATVLKIKC